MITGKYISRIISAAMAALIILLMYLPVIMTYILHYSLQE